MKQLKRLLMCINFFILSTLLLFNCRFVSRAETKQVMIELDAVSDDTIYYSPSADADYTLTLKNLLGPAWVRVKFQLKQKNIDADFTEQNLKISDNWVKRGDYYYYTKKADAYTDYIVVNGVIIPNVQHATEPASVTIIADADAIQYSAFFPDFNNEDPWKDAKIESSSSSSSSSSSKSDHSSSIHIYNSPEQSGQVSTGNWVLIDSDNHIWKYRDNNGNYAKNGWIYVYNPYSPDKNRYDWFHFGSDEIMTYGWYKASEKTWYYTHDISDGNLGMLITGWHDDTQDEKRYYLDENTGIMLSGWQNIDGNYYYFATYEEIPQQTWFWRLVNDTKFGKWFYELLGHRSYGAMYVDEITPDGYTVDANGIWINYGGSI